MTEEQTQAVARVQAQPPSILPSGEEAVKLVKQFEGWNESKDGKPLPIKMSTAVAIHGLVNMGILPAHINVLGGKPYVTVDGMIAHAQRVIEQRGETWGRITYTTELTDDELKRLGNPKDNVAVLKATYETMLYRTVHKTNKDGSTEDYQEPVWFAEQTGLGSGDPTGKNPVEKQYPERMAEARATRRLLKVMAGIVYPAAVEQALSGTSEVIVAVDNTPVLEEATESVTEVAADTTEVVEDEVVEVEAVEVEEEPVVDEETGAVEETDGPPLPDGEPIEGKVADKVVRAALTALEGALISNAKIGKFSFAGAKGRVAVSRALQAGYSTAQLVKMVGG